jgi:membrane protein
MSKIPGNTTNKKVDNKVDNSLAAIVKEFYKRFNEDEITTRAAALAFVGVFSLVPILLFAVIALGFVFRDPGEANRHVQQFVSQLLPGESASKAANDVLAQTHLVETAQGMTHHIGWPLVIGVASLLWAGISLFVTAAVPMNTAWDVTETRSFLKLRMIALGVLCGAGLVFLLSLVVSAMPRVVANLTPPLFGTPGEVPLWAGALLALLAIGLDALMFILIYKFLPNVKVTWKAAIFSGVATGLLWEAFKQMFAYYLAHFGNSNNKLYGALGGIVLLITWIYYSCIILLAGAIVGKMFHEHREEGGVTERAPRQTAA